MTLSTPRAIALLMLALTTCSGIDNIEITEMSSATIEGAGPFEQLLSGLGFGSFIDLDITQNETLQNQGVTREQIDSVRITRLRLRITSPQSGDFTFLSSLKFFVSSDGLEKKLIASGGPFPKDTPAIDLALENVELAPYVAAPSMDITTEATGRSPPVDTTIEATIDIGVDVDVGGVICGG